jgi:D-alanyl-D-alanine carboxypeptidase
MKLGVALQVRFPQYYPLFSIQSYSFRGRFIGNHNNLLGRVDGVDGIKTGYVNASGFNIVTSVKRDGRKIVAVVMGGKTAAQRDAHVVQLVNTFLPKATRARGYDGDLVASVVSAPKVAGAPARQNEDVDDGVKLASLAGHPSPAPRPVMAPVADVAANDNDNDESTMPATRFGMAGTGLLPPAPVPSGAPAEPVAEAPRAHAVVAEAAPEPHRSQPEQAPTSLANATLPASLARAKLPSSAAEAFADVAPMPRPDPMAQLVEASAPPRPYQVANAEGNVATDAVPMPMQPESVATTSSLSRQHRAAATGWVIQIGTATNERGALELLQRARASVGVPLKSAEPVTESVGKGAKAVIRARFAGFADQQAATKACSALKKKSFSCFPLRL